MNCDNRIMRDAEASTAELPVGLPRDGYDGCLADSLGGRCQRQVEARPRG